MGDWYDKVQPRLASNMFSPSTEELLHQKPRATSTRKPEDDSIQSLIASDKLLEICINDIQPSKNEEYMLKAYENCAELYNQRKDFDEMAEDRLHKLRNPTPFERLINFIKELFTG